MSKLVEEQAAFAQDVGRLLAKAAELGFDVTLGEAWRSPETQEIYLRDGRSQTMASNHLRRLAMDLNFFREGKLVERKEELQALGDWWEGLHGKNRWGGNFHAFVDAPHFERDA